MFKQSQEFGDALSVYYQKILDMDTRVDNFGQYYAIGGYGFGYNWGIWPQYSSLWPQYMPPAVTAFREVSNSRMANGIKAFAEEQYAQALELLTPVAEGGNADAAYLVGEMYGPRSWGQEGENRHGVEQDNAKAIQWWKEAAQAGHAKAQLKLGWYLMHGKGVVPVDAAQGLAWLAKSAAQGEPQAQYEAGLAYWQGNGTKVDLVEARKWFILVAPRDGFDKAKGYLQEMARQMTAEQIAAAEAAARAFSFKAKP